MAIEKSNGLIVSENVLRELEKLELNKNVNIGVFTNCRECGYTFMVSTDTKSFTWCVYEHRNSDEIIINGREGYISDCGDLPYNGESKYDYLASFEYEDYESAAMQLAEFINEFN